MKPLMLVGHSDSVLDVAWQPDGDMLASAGREGSVRLWREGSLVVEWPMDGRLSCVAWSRRGGLLAAGTESGLVQLWDTRSRTRLLERRCGPVEAVAFSADDDDLLVAEAAGTVHAWSRRVGRPNRHTEIGSKLFNLRVSPAGVIALACTGRILLLRDLQAPPIADINLRELIANSAEAHARDVDAYDCVVSPDGETCAASIHIHHCGAIGVSANPDLFEILVWDGISGQVPVLEESLLGHAAWIRAVEFSPDGEVLSSASFDESVRFWDVERLTELAVLKGHSAAVYRACFASDGARLATCSADKTIRIWNVAELRAAITGGLTEAAGRRASGPVRIAASLPPRRKDGIGSSDFLSAVCALTDDLLDVQSRRALQELVVSRLPVRDAQRNQAVLQIANIRAEQARREGADEWLHHVRRLQSEVVFNGEAQHVIERLWRSRHTSQPATISPGFERLEPRQRSVKVHELVRQLIDRGPFDQLAWRVREAEQEVALTLGSDASTDPARRAERTRDAVLFSLFDEFTLHLRAGPLHVNAARQRAAVEAAMLLVSDRADPVVKAAAFGHLGLVTCLTGEHELGARRLRDALAHARHAASIGQQCAILGWLGNALRNVGRLREAERAYLESIELAGRHGLVEGFITENANLAMVYGDLGDVSRELHCLRMAVTAARRLGDSGRLAGPLNSLAGVYSDLGDGQAAAETYMQVAEIARHVGDERLEGNAWGNLGDVARARNSPDTALQAYQLSLAFARRVGNADGEVHALDGLAAIERLRGRASEAERLTRETVRIARAQDMPARLSVALHNLALFHVDRGEIPDARRLLSEAVDVAERLRVEFDRPEEGVRVQLDLARLYAELVHVEVRDGLIAEAFAHTEMSRAVLFLRRFHPEGQSATAAAASAGETVRAGRIAEALRALGPRAVLVSYHAIDRLLIFVSRATAGIQVREVPVSRSALEAAVQALRDDMAPNRAGDPESQQWRTLSETLVDPVLPYLHDGDILLLVPHGPLHDLPLHALLADGERVIDRWPVTYLPSASVLPTLAARTRRPIERAVVVGAHFIDEAVAVADRLKSDHALIGDRLEKRAVLASMSAADILHISAHGYFLPEQPRRSGIILQPSSSLREYLERLGRPRRTQWVREREMYERAWVKTAQHVLLTVDDLAALELRAQLVCLSACDSGLTHTDAADDPVGLIPALLASGASGVLATLWLVNPDAARTAMVAFYDNLWRNEGWEAMPRALRSAILEVKQKEPHPYYWAPFVLVGGVAGIGPC